MKATKTLLSIIFLFEGVTKLLAMDFQIQFFSHWGYPLWFMYVIGLLELLGAIGLWFPKLTLYANIGLIGIMIGAFYTHVSSGNAIIMMSLAILASFLLIIHLYLLKKQSLKAVQI